MVDPILTQRMIDLGAKAVAALDSSDIHTDAAFWLLREEAGWRLVLSIPSFEGDRPSDSYASVLRVLREHGVLELSASDLEVAKSASLYVQLLRTAISLPGPEIGSVRFKGNVVNGYLIEDAFIYRMERGPTMSQVGTVKVPTAPMAPGTGKRPSPHGGKSRSKK
jgi:hypothetical protein